MNPKLHLLAATSLAAAAFAGSAFAQTGPATQASAAAGQGPAAPPAAAAATTLEELVVTAEKREQSLQDVPVAISAFTSKQRDLLGIATIQDYTNFTPGLSYSTATDRASLRGIGRLTNIHSADAAVAIYIDGVYSTSTVLAGAPPIELERVEILRGPQGTLYGRNSIGGTINQITVHPTDHPYAEVRAIAENFGYTNFQFAASGPLADHLRVRFAGYKLDQTEGYYKNVVPGQPSEGAKRNEYEYQFQVSADLGDHAEAWFKFQTLKWNDRGGPGARTTYMAGQYELGIVDPRYAVIYNPAFGYSGNIVPGSLQQFFGGTATSNPALRDPHLFNADTPERVTLSDTRAVAANFVYHMPSFDIKYIGGLQTYKYDFYGDVDQTDVQSYQIPLATGSICGTVHTLFSIGRVPADCSPLTVQAQNTFHYFEYPTWYSHEVNLTSTDNSPLQWIAGAYYYHEEYSATTNDADLFSPRQAQFTTPLLGAAGNPNNAFLIDEYDMTTQSAAVFGQLDWKPTETLKFTLGLRYTHDRKFGVERRRVVCFSDACMPGLYSTLGLGGFGPGTAANYGSLLGNFPALAQLGPFLGLGNALAPLAFLGNGAFDLTTTLAPTTGPGGAKGVTDPVKCNSAGVCTQYTIDPATGVMIRHLDDTSSATTGTLGVQWDPEPGTMAYARYSRGYKAFGFAAGGGLVEPEAEPEFVNAYEIGLKKSLGLRLQIDAAIYYLDYRNLQAPLPFVIGPTTVTEFVNIAKSRSTGLELDAVWQPIDPLRLMLDYSYDNTRILKSGTYVDVNNNVITGPQSVVGNRLPQAPLNKVAVSAIYTWTFDPGALTAGVSYVWRDKVYSNVFSTPGNSAPSWDQTDLRATFTPTSNKWTAIAYVKNVFDQRGYDAAVTALQRTTGAYGASVYELTPPRIYGLELQYRFF